MRASIQEIFELRSCVIATLKLKCVALVWVRLRIIFAKAALQKRGSMEPNEPPLDPPLIIIFFVDDVSGRLCNDSA